MTKLQKGQTDQWLLGVEEGMGWEGREYGTIVGEREESPRWNSSVSWLHQYQYLGADITTVFQDDAIRGHWVRGTQVSSSLCYIVTCASICICNKSLIWKFKVWISLEEIGEKGTLGRQRNELKLGRQAIVQGMCWVGNKVGVVSQGQITEAIV